VSCKVRYSLTAISSKPVTGTDGVNSGMDGVDSGTEGVDSGTEGVHSG
jgi:hypothetical protein